MYICVDRLEKNLRKSGVMLDADLVKPMKLSVLLRQGISQLKIGPFSR